MPKPAAPFAFPHAARLRTSGEFARVQRSGQLVDLRALVFRVAPMPGTPPLPFGRLGLAISRKVGNAVERNRVKRLVRESFRHRKAFFAGRDLVVTGRPEAVGLRQMDVDRLFEELQRRVGDPGPRH